MDHFRFPTTMDHLWFLTTMDHLRFPTTMDHLRIPNVGEDRGSEKRGTIHDITFDLNIKCICFHTAGYYSRPEAGENIFQCLTGLKTARIM